MDVLGVAFGLVLILVYVLVFGINIANYVLKSLGLFRLAKKQGISKAWLSWLPIGREWVLGSFVDNLDRKRGLNRKWRIALISIEILLFLFLMLYYIALIVVVIIGVSAGFSDVVMSFLPLFMVYVAMIPIMLSFVALFVLQVVCEYRIYDELYPEKTLKYLLLSFLLPLAYGIILLRLAKKYGEPEEIIYIPAQNVDSF